MTVPHITYVRGGKSGLQRAGCFLTGRRGDPTDSATENIPPPHLIENYKIILQGVRVRVKRRGKSSPPWW